jgi:hypothetical protein
LPAQMDMLIEGLLIIKSWNYSSYRCMFLYNWQKSQYP